MALAVQYVAIAAVLAACVFWFRSWLRRRSPGALALFLCLLSLDVAMLIGAHYEAVADLVGVPSLTQIIIHTAVLSCAFWLQMFTLHLGSSPARVRARARLRLVVLVCCLLTLYALYVIKLLPQRLPAINGAYGDRPYVLVYLSVFSCALSWAIGDIAWTTRFARHVPDRYLRLGLQFIRYGAVFGLLFALHKATQTVLTAVGAPLPWAEYDEYTGTGTYLLVVGTFLSLTGFMLPSLGPRWERRRTLARLEPLWRALTAEAPELVFSSDTNGTADRLRNRITEIRDVLVGPLQPYLHPSAAEEARRLGAEQGLDGEDLLAVAEAATIAVALHAKSNEIQAPTAESIVFESPPLPDQGAEALWLAKVSTAFTTSPVVAAVVAGFVGEEVDRAAQ